MTEIDCLDLIVTVKPFQLVYCLVFDDYRNWNFIESESLDYKYHTLVLTLAKAKVYIKRIDRKPWYTTY